MQPHERSMTTFRVSWLPAAEAREVATGPGAMEFILGGYVEAGALFVCRGDFFWLRTPLEFFTASGDATPDFSDFEVIDHGHAVRFGRYHAAARAILYSRLTTLVT